MFLSSSSTARLSDDLERRFQVGHAVVAGRAAVGLKTVLSIWRSRRSECRVAMPGAICHEVLLAVLLADCEPIFLDVDVADGLVPAAEWLRARTLGADVALVVHLYGNPAQTDRVRSIFPAPDHLVIDDAAQALGAFNEHGQCGSSGDIGLLSFGRSKQISIGNGAVLVRDPALAEEIAARLPGAGTPSAQCRQEMEKVFRSNLDAARVRLIATERPDAGGFAGLLRGMDWMLDVTVDQGLTDALLAALDRYPADSRARCEKAHLWQRLLEGTGMVPVGMGFGCVPWRYVCRVPGMSWQAQASLAGAIRRSGIDVSTWYLPAHWFVGLGIGTLPGVEKLSREVFQFWVDAPVTHESIANSAQVVGRELTRLGHFTKSK